MKRLQIVTVDSSTTADSYKNDEEEDDLGIAATDEIHAGFKIDSVSDLEKALNLSIETEYVYPLDDIDGVYKRLVYHTIDTALKAFKKELKSNMGNNFSIDSSGLSNDFEAKPINFYEDENIVSVRFVLSSSTRGAAHLISGWKSINFNKRTHKTFSVKDYFDFKTREDSSLIVNLLEEEYSGLRNALAQENAWEFYNINGMDFNIKKDSISFNFSDYALGQGPSMIAHKVSKERLKGLIRPIYK